MKCPTCGGVELVNDTREVKHDYKGRKTVIPGLDGLFCDACGEVIFNEEQSAAFSIAAAAFNHQVNAANDRQTARRTVSEMCEGIHPQDVTEWRESMADDFATPPEGKEII